MPNILQFIGESEADDNTMRISDFDHVMKFFSKHGLADEVKDIPVYVVPAEDWPEGKSMRTQNDRKGGIEIHEDFVDNDEPEGWLVHEVGHVLDLNGKRMPYIVPREEFDGYPNEDDEQTAMFYQFNYLIDKGMSKDDILRMEETSYRDAKNGPGTWKEYKDRFFRAYYDALTEK